MTPLEYHAGRAQKLYRQYRRALAKVDAYEQDAIHRAGGDPVMAMPLLSDRSNPQPAYKVLTGAKAGVVEQLQVELNMVALYVRLKTAGYGVDENVTEVYRDTAL